MTPPANVGSATRRPTAMTKMKRFISVTWFGVTGDLAMTATRPAAIGRIR